MLIPQMARARDVGIYLETFLKSLKLKIDMQNVITIFFELYLFLHITACLWMASTEANLYDYNNWLCGNGLQDENLYI